MSPRQRDLETDAISPASDVAFTPAVKAMQTRLGSRAGYARMEQRGGWSREVSEDLRDFIAERDSFYLGTATTEGQPYVQHRGGPPGFLHVLDASTLAFVDFSGNRQYISGGNLSENDRAFLFLMDYVNRKRVKVWGRADVVEGDSELLQRLLPEGYPARGERVIRFHVEAWDANCPKHITPRFTEAQVQERTAPLRARVAELEAELARLGADDSA
jgi:predicted pyridoxine 5'-phosphate oxidase superfamily flavin-nucleotide-binding protein